MGTSPPKATDRMNQGTAESTTFRCAFWYLFEFREPHPNTNMKGYRLSSLGMVIYIAFPLNARCMRFDRATGQVPNLGPVEERDEPVPRMPAPAAAEPVESAPSMLCGRMENSLGALEQDMAAVIWPRASYSIVGSVLLHGPTPLPG